MEKKFVSVIISLLVLLQSFSAFATGEYYNYRELEKITPEMLAYKPVDVMEMTNASSEIERLVTGTGNENAIFELTELAFNETCDIYNSYALATVAYDRNTSEENKKNLDEITTEYIRSTSILSDIVYTLYDSMYQDLLIDIFGDIQTALDFTLPDNDELTPLLDKESELVKKYSELYGDTDACAELYLELIDVRNDIAEIFGYSNYAEYANEYVYNRDISENELDEFNHGVKEYIFSLYLHSIMAMNSIGTSAVPMTEDDVLLTSRSAVANINAELLDAFDYLIENNLYDIRDSEMKNDSVGAYTIYLLKPGVPFLYINPYIPFEENGVQTVSVCIHEFGHFAAMLNDPIANIDKFSTVFATTSIETAEIHSLGLEALSERYYGRMYGSEAAYQRYMFLAMLTWEILQGSMFNDWQIAAYSMENPTVDELTLLLQDLSEEYIGVEYAFDDAKEIWTQLHHNYSMPMYYLSYALSGMAALNIYSSSITDYSGAVDTYMQISAEGIYKDFDELIKEYKLDGIYDINEINRIYSNIFEYYGYSTCDLEYDAWYVPYVNAVSNIMPAKTYGMFMPDIAITRSDFVGAIGRMYDYYEGIDGECENPFSDIASTDENVKYISWASENGIVDGYSEYIFGGNDALTREQAAAIISRIDECIPENDDSINKFADSDSVSEWARTAVGWMAENGIIEGRGNGEFDPKANITRAEAAKILSGYIKATY